MKNTIKTLISFFTVLLLFSSCEEKPLDTSFRADSDINFIVIEVSEPELMPDETEGDQIIEDEEGTGLPIVPATLTTDSNITVSASSNIEDVLERRWVIPSVLPNGTLEYNVIETLEPITNLNFSRPNNPDVFGSVETAGFPIVLTETFKDGSIESYTTHIRIRRPVVAMFSEVIEASTGETVLFRVNTRADLGLEETDMNGNNQSLLTWTFNDAYSINGELVSERGEDGETIVVDNILPIEVVYNTPGMYDVSLDVIRNYPARSFSKEPFESSVLIINEKLILPNAGAGNESIVLNPLGDQITLIYDQPIADVSGLDTSVFDLNYNFVSGLSGEEVVVNVPVTSVENDPLDPNKILLNFDEPIPFYAASTLLSYSSTDVKSADGNAQLARYEGTLVASEANNNIPDGHVYDILSQDIGSIATLTGVNNLDGQELDAESTITISDEELNPLSPSVKLMKIDRAPDKANTVFYFVDIEGLIAGEYVLALSARATSPLALLFWNRSWGNDNFSVTTEWQRFYSNSQTIPDGPIGFRIQLPTSTAAGYQMYLSDIQLIRIGDGN